MNISSKAIAVMCVLLLASAPAWAEIRYTVTDLGTLGGSYSHAYGINDSGQIVGWASISGDAASHAFLYNGSTMTDLGTLGGKDSWASSINASGQVVGWSNTADNTTDHAFLYNGSTMIDLGTLVHHRS